jgi:hypothetical protein
MKIRDSREARVKIRARVMQVSPLYSTFYHIRLPILIILFTGGLAAAVLDVVEGKRLF